MELAGRLWGRFGWQVSAATALSLLSVFSIIESPLVEWLHWFGEVGGFVTVLAMRIIPPPSRMWLSLSLGFVVNVAFWTFLFLGAGWVRRRTTQRWAVEH